MHTLYPIIRRKRRPLVEAQAETLKTETLKPQTEKQNAETEPEKNPTLEKTDVGECEQNEPV